MPSTEKDSVGIPPARVTVELGLATRTFTWVVMLASLGFGSWLAYKNYTGVATAAVFAVALIFAVAALGGVLPSSISIGQVRIAIDRAKDEGKKEGAEQAAAIAMAPLDQARGIVAAAPSAFRPHLQMVLDAREAHPDRWNLEHAIRPLPGNVPEQPKV